VRVVTEAFDDLLDVLRDASSGAISRLELLELLAVGSSPFRIR
jgi:hypothetical protein